MITRHRSSRPPPDGRVLIVEDQPEVAYGYARILEAGGLHAAIALDAESALRRLQVEEFDAVIADMILPTTDGLDLVRVIRGHLPDLPVVLMTAQPSLETAIRSVEAGVFRYLVKPIEPDALVDVACKAVRNGREARIQRIALEEHALSEERISQHDALMGTFAGALDKLFMVTQPVVSLGRQDIVAYEVLVRSSDPAMPHPGALFDAADRLSAQHTIGQAIRRCIARDIAALPEGTLAFINIHPADLLDETIFDPSGPLTCLAGRAVLELTERGSIDDIPDIKMRVNKLRELGFRIAIDDLGAGYSGLTTFAHIEPEVAKLDMSLVRNVHREPTKRRLIQSLGSFCADMGIQLVCEGVETREERDALVELGCDLHQGYLYAKPAKPFPTASW